MITEPMIIIHYQDFVPEIINSRVGIGFSKLNWMSKTNFKYFGYRINIILTQILDVLKACGLLFYTKIVVRVL